VSRLASRLSSDEQKNAAMKIREALAAHHRAEDLINLGAYTAGTNAALDASIRVRPQLLSFLKQESAANSPMPETLASMKLLASALK